MTFRDADDPVIGCAGGHMAPTPVPGPPPPYSDRELWRSGNRYLRLAETGHYLAAYHGSKLKTFSWGMMEFALGGGALTYEGAVRRALLWLNAPLKQPTTQLERGREIANEMTLTMKWGRR